MGSGSADGREHSWRKGGLAPSELHAVGRAHLGEGEQERERRLGTLVFVQAIRVETISATARRGIVERGVQAVFAEEPAERTRSMFSPDGVPGNASRSRQADTIVHASTGC